MDNVKNSIIVADDSAIIKNIVKKALEEEFDVLEASNGREVIEVIGNNRDKNIVGLLLDLNMPGYDGFTVLEYFKNYNLFSKIPVSIISGDDTPETIQRAFSYEIVDLLNKPFSQDKIRMVAHKTISIGESKKMGM
jgi:putative two-component system response regulator